MNTATPGRFGLKCQFTGTFARIIEDRFDDDSNAITPRYRLTSGNDDEADFQFIVDTAA
jgi:hypothetical protein